MLPKNLTTTAAAAADFPIEYQRLSTGKINDNSTKLLITGLPAE